MDDRSTRIEYQLFVLNIVYALYAFTYNFKHWFVAQDGISVLKHTLRIRIYTSYVKIVLSYGYFVQLKL